MTVAKVIAVSAALVVCCALSSFGANVFAVPSSPFDTSVPVFSENPFQGSGNVAGVPGAVAILAKPDGSKYYVVSASPTDTVLVVDGALTTVLRRFDLGEPAKAAVITPDGKRLLVLTSTLRVFNLTDPDDDEINVVPTPDVGVDPIDLAVTMDSKRAYILSDESDWLTTFDLTTNEAGGTVNVPGIATGVAVSPTGLVYVTATNRLFEIDGATGAVRGQINMSARPGKAVFTPDGKYAILPNKTPSTGSVALLVDLKTRTVVGTIPNSGPTAGMLLDHLSVVGDTQVYAVATNAQRLVRITIDPFQLKTTGFPLDTTLGIFAAHASRDLPAPKYLFAATSNQIFRVTLSGSVTASLSLPDHPKQLLVAGGSSSAAPVGWRKLNDDQTLLGGAKTLPLVLQVWDSAGVPVFNRAVQFTTTTAGAIIEVSNTTTNLLGYAVTRVTVPETPGPFTITANVNGLSSPVDFKVTVAGGGGGGTGGLSIYSGNGQIVPRGYPTNKPLKVLVRDAQGAPIIDAEVNWSIVSGNQGPGLSSGLLAAPGSSGTSARSTTDINGIAEMTYVGPSFLPSTTSWLQTMVEATATGLNTVAFSTIAVPNLPDGTPAIPTIVLTKPPQADRSLSGQSGQTLIDGVEFTANAISGFSSGRGVPGVGVDLSTGLDPTTTPSAKCADPTALSADTGIGKCDVVFGGVTGTTQLRVVIGGIREFVLTSFEVKPGPPGAVTILGGNNQSGNAGQALPLLLEAQVSDGFGHNLAGVPVTWEVVVPGTVTLSNAGAVTNLAGRVTAKATLGGTSGQAQVRVKAGTAQATFNLLVNVSLSSLAKVDGDGQSATVNTAFAKALVVQVKDGNGAVVQGASVAFAVTSGAASVSTSNATTDAQGRASTTVTAGGTAGPIVVTASAGSLSQSFSLTATPVVPPGPVVTLDGIRSAISGDLGVSPGSVVAIYGDGIAPGIDGSVVGNSLVGPLPLALANVEVLFGTTPAPIYSVNNVNGQQFVVVQAPFELAAPGTATLTIKVSGGTRVVNNVPVKPYQPGIFETLGDGGKRYAVLLRPDGSYVSPANRARKGERIRMFLSGLGQTNPALGTNYAGIAGQKVLASMIVGINYAGIPFVSVETMAGVVGVYVLTFDVPADAPSALDVPLNVGILMPDASPTVFGNTSAIHIQ